MRSIASIPAYFFCALHVLVLHDAMRNGIRDYLSRGHCLLELATARLPRIDETGRWQIPLSGTAQESGSVVALDTADLSTSRWSEEGGALPSGLQLRSPLAGSFTIDAADPAGNALVQVVGVTDSSSVTFDETVPTLTAVSLTSDRSANTVVVGGIVALSLTAIAILM